MKIMKTNTFDIFIIEPESKVTYINKQTKESWNWKLFKDCSDEEKLKINLASYPSNTILFDRDLKEYNEQQINEDYGKYVQMLRKRGIKYFFAYRSPNGYHVIAPFKGLNQYEEDLRKELRKYYISLFESDPAKISDKGVVSLPGRPHFKNSQTYEIHDNYEGENEFPNTIVDECIARVSRNKKLSEKLLQDKNFEDYFETDPFFAYISGNIVPKGTSRDMTLFPNLAIAAVRSGKTKEEIENIIKPVILKNFPGKSYAEFEGWYKKAVKGEIED
jgi:hypothetical protein